MYLVGGGAFLAPDDLRGVSKVHRFPHYECANAVGAAIAQVAGWVDSVEIVEGRTIAEARRGVEAEAIKRAIEGGARPETVSVIESEAIPVAYTAGRCRFFVKAAGEWDGDQAQAEVEAEIELEAVVLGLNKRVELGQKDALWPASDILAYRPEVSKGVWSLSEIDLEFVCIGTYIMGCGGGGDPTHTFLAARELVRKGHKINVIDLGSVGKDGLLGWGGGMGSPEVASERMLGEE